MSRVLSGDIKLTPATYARAAMSRLAGRWWWVIVFPMAACVVASVWNVAYLILAMIWIFMLLPPAVMITYYSYLLKPEVAALSRTYRVVISEGADVRVIFVPGEDDEMTTPDMFLPGVNLRSINEGSDYLELSYRGCDIDMLLIPYTAISTEEIATALVLLQSNQ